MHITCTITWFQLLSTILNSEEIVKWQTYRDEKPASITYRILLILHCMQRDLPFIE